MTSYKFIRSLPTLVGRLLQVAAQHKRYHPSTVKVKTR